MTSPFRVVFMIGGTGSGRRTAAQILAKTSAVGPVVIDAFSYELRERCHAAFKIVDNKNLPAPAHYFEGQLDVPLELFNGLTPRSAYFKFGKFSDEVFGRGARGKWVADRINYFRKLQEQRVAENRRVRSVVIIDDAPVESYLAVVDAFGAENCTQLTVRRDSTVAWPYALSGVRGAEVKNRGKDLAEFELALRDAVPHLYIQVATEVPPVTQ